ncbi:kinase-like domain-containing protein [Obelidium mucronatum]|nr:kinase-like domain-containing protein [Obelidium mucronatum]
MDQQSSQVLQQHQQYQQPQPQTPPPPPPFELVGNGRWQVKEMIGAGSFGEVFAAVDAETGAHIAIKREVKSSRKQQLPHESAVYDLLRRSEGFPRIYFSGQEGPYNILVMERLGPSLKELERQSPTQKIPLRTIVRLVPQFIRRIQSLHELGIIFRDVINSVSEDTMKTSPTDPPVS